MAVVKRVYLSVDDIAKEYLPMYVIKTDYDFDGEEAKNLDTILKSAEVSFSPVRASITGQRMKQSIEISA